jgi:cyclic pyranopterin phosphate synthase
MHATGPLVAARPALVDTIGRRIDYLRVSVTDRCNYRCTYCLGDKPRFAPARDILSLGEIERLTTAFVDCGIRRIRLTGGEPLARHGIVGLVRSLARLRGAGLDEITMTTNGSLLPGSATALAEAGLARVNVSLDTLDPDRFAAVTRRGDLAEVLAGIEAAARVGLKVKLNAVVQAGVEDREIEALVDFAHARGHDLALIETMPVGDVAGRGDGFVPLAAIRAGLERRHRLVDLPAQSGGPARWVRLADTGGRIAFITPMSHDFCGECNRVRLTATGRLVLCLGRKDGVDLAPLVRAETSTDEIVAAIRAAVALKPTGHDFAHAAETGAHTRTMNVTGG